MSEGEEKVVPLTRREVERRVPSLGTCVFTAPSVAVDTQLAHYYSADEPDVRAFVNELVAAVVKTPELDAAEVDSLSESARAIMRVATAEAAGCGRAYHRLAGSGLGGEERLYRAMRERHEENIARVRDAVGAMHDNVVRMVERTQRTLRQAGALDFVERNRRQIENMNRLVEQTIRPPVFDHIERMNRLVEQTIRPSVIEQLSRPDSALNIFARGYASMAERLSRQLQSVLQPEYFGGLERIQRQINEAIRPAHLDALTRATDQIRKTVRPQYLDALARISDQIVRAVSPAHVDQMAALGDRLRQLTTTPLFDSVRGTLLGLLEAYATLLERRYPKVFANPDKPPPFLFLVASLPLWIAVPLLDALVEGDDEPLLQRLEEAIDGTAVVDVVQAALQQTPSLDEYSKRHLVHALDDIRDGRYVDAAPPLYQGLERAFRETARRQGVIDPVSESLVGGDRRGRARVEEFLGHLIDDARYLRFLRSWVFGREGDAARHGGLRGDEAYRRWVLRGFVAVVGWLEYCAEDEEPMRALKAQLELGRGEPGVQEETG
jgi:hypothetical protein